MLVFMERAVLAEDSTKTKNQKWKVCHTFQKQQETQGDWNGMNDQKSWKRWVQKARELTEKCKNYDHFGFYF